MNIKKNEKCFIGNPACGYFYESAKLCFLACPSDEKYNIKIELIKNIVESKQYECHIALRKCDPANFAFCTKICSKIIQSQFCIVLLDPSIDKKGNEYPNPNVHLEYGMMVSQHKHVIPLQEEKYSLAFNISPLDTIKYTDANFTIKVTKAIDNAIEKYSKDETIKQVILSPEIFTFYSLSHFQLSDINIPIYNYIFKFGSFLGFNLFNNGNKFKYLGNFNYENPKKIVLHTKLLINNIISTYKNLTLDDSGDAKKKKYNYLINSISIDIIIPPNYEKEVILNKIASLVENEYTFPTVMYYQKEIKKTVEDEYKHIGDIKSIKNSK